jgi:thioredoxin-related protein
MRTPKTAFRIFSFVLFSFFSLQVSAQETGLVNATDEAKKDGKHILIIFSGSDWCIPCIRLEKEVFTKQTFTTFADSCLVIVKADFPRLKKHQLPKEEKMNNEVLAERYNKQGSFPFTVLTDENGKVLKTWEGASVGTPENFVSQLKSFFHDR